MAQLYADENFPVPVVQELRRLGHDVLALVETDHAGQSIPDDVVLESATNRNRALLTLNRRHFIRLHGIRPGHAGIIVCTFDPDFADQAGRIHAAIESQPELAGQLIRVNRPAA